MTVESSRLVIQPVGRVLIIPIPGLVDNQLIGDLRQRLLERLGQKRVKGVIFDMSGVNILDGDDFERLLTVIEASRLMGSSVVMAGIQPGVAAGLLMLGADTGKVKTALTVEQAMVMLS